jgi:hypothetical protein
MVATASRALAAGAVRLATAPLTWRDRNGSWHWHPDHLHLVRLLRAVEPSVRPVQPPLCARPDRGLEVRTPPSPREVREIMRALAAAGTWEELLRVAQRIWDCPVDEHCAPMHGGRPMPSARTQLCDAYRRGVERLWGTHAPCVDLLRPAAGRPRKVAA